ncbi:DUF397 domain-containing protein [Streptomyces sp. NPDC052095]|uniref:DUF397 domain-containing protein n=1 Tax=unclassified Streptomyces TaxID=2593676 RepID=UPI00344D1330
MALPPTGWHRSSYSGDFEDACVEACADGGNRGVFVRDTKDPVRRPLAVSGPAWRAFLGALGSPPAGTVCHEGAGA